MKVLILSQYFPPEQFFIPEQLAVDLVSRGHHVEVLTSFPNYPSGKIYEGYKQSWTFTEKYRGIKITRVPMFMDHSRNAISRALNYLSFGVSSAFKFQSFRNFDVIYVYASQMTAAMAPSIWKIIGGKIPFVLHIQDLWPESVTSSGMIPGNFLRTVLNRLLNYWISFVYSQSSQIIAIAPTMTKLLVSRGVPASKVFTIFNWADTDNIAVQNQMSKQNEIVEVVYAGNIGYLQNLRTAVLAAEKMKPYPQFRLTLVGDGNDLEELMKLVDSRKISNVNFVGRVPSSEISKIYETSKFLFISLKDLEIFRGTIPSKFQTSISLGIPVIAAVPGDIKQIVEEYEIGLAAEPGNIDSLYECFKEALKISGSNYKQMEKNSTNLYKSRMSREISVPQIEAVLSESAGK